MSAEAQAKTIENKIDQTTTTTTTLTPSNNFTKTIIDQPTFSLQPNTEQTNKTKKKKKKNKPKKQLNNSNGTTDATTDATNVTTNATTNATNATTDATTNATNATTNVVVVNCCLYCGNVAQQRCPKCTELALFPSYFCSQECFKKQWSFHKFIHSAPHVPPHFAAFSFTGTLRPACVTPMRTVSPHIQRPDYSETGDPRSERLNRSSSTIQVYNGTQIEGIRKACKIAREVLNIAARSLRPGITTDQIDQIVHQEMIARNAYPSPLNYSNFPKSCCTSINEVICHGIPDCRPLQEGDICNLDITAYYNGYHGDVNDTYYIGEVDAESHNLVETARECLNQAIAIVKPGTLYREVGNIINRIANQRGCSVVRSYCGHGIGELFHCAPNVPHYANNKAVGVMKAGHIFTIEPMINAGGWQDKLWPDNWTSVTKDGKRSAQFEHTLLVTPNGCEVLTA
eukprot:TRINITY_DN501_c0_g1_i1.p1 TRINITY_DN501_c0_g1~~TRINITY_DN501_c0_g1_i1.p1  ORF type:complete len:473 (-),score=205.07 TRINITY_DN501_c0_g1_i1:144-1511(-)